MSEAGNLLPQEALASFCQANAVRRLALFGSRARGHSGPQSDYDIVVDLRPDARVGLVRFQQMRAQLEALLGRPVDLVTEAGLNRHIRDEVLRNARIVYAE